MSVKNLTVSFSRYDHGFNKYDLEVIHSLDVEVYPGEVVAVVGASGSGKSLLAHSVLGILPENATVTGEMAYMGQPLTCELQRKLRGRDMVLIPQSVEFLDPLMKVGKQVRRGRRDRETVSRQRELFSQYGLAQEVEEKYPFACSGGMSRRILLATALMENPRLIIADEPTPGMELSLAGKAMEDFRRFADMGNGVLLITHDIELALKVADRIAVFYAGTTVEEALVSDFESEELLRHPYTKALWRAMPRNGFHPIDGVQPYVKDLPKGCVFGPRCPDFSQECEGEIPERVIRCGTVRCIKCMEDHSHHHHGGKEAHEHAGS